MDTRAELDNKTSELASATQQLDAAKKDVEAKKTEIANLSSEKEKLNADLGEAKANLEKSKTELTAATEKATALEAELSTAKSDVEAKDAKITELETQVATGGGAPAPAAESGIDTKAIQTELDETKTLLTAAQDRNTGLEAQISEYRRKEVARQNSQMRQGIQGTILAVNQAWNFVVLSIGDRQGVVNNAEMLIQRGSQLIGKVRVTSVEPSTAIADVIVRTVPRGFSVMPGDTVIYPAQGSN
jgi:chromosome segregation ATPase